MFTGKETQISPAQQPLGTAASTSFPPANGVKPLSIVLSSGQSWPSAFLKVGRAGCSLISLYLEEEVCRSSATLVLESCPPWLHGRRMRDFSILQDMVSLGIVPAWLWEWAQQAQGPEGSLPLMSKDSKDTGFLILIHCAFPGFEYINIYILMTEFL